MCVPHVEGSLHFGPQLDLTHLALIHIPQECGCWVMGTLRAGACHQSSPEGGLGSVPEWTHRAGWWDTG